MLASRPYNIMETVDVLSGYGLVDGHTDAHLVQPTPAPKPRYNSRGQLNCPLPGCPGHIIFLWRDRSGVCSNECYRDAPANQDWVDKLVDSIPWHQRQYRSLHLNGVTARKDLSL
jgi:hypothetical protein